MAIASTLKLSLTNPDQENQLLDILEPEGPLLQH